MHPPLGFARWDGKLIAAQLDLPDWLVWKRLREEGIQLARKRAWCVSRDPDFSATPATADEVGSLRLQA